MPCDTIQVSNIDLGAVRVDVLQASIESMGLSGDITQGRASGRVGGSYVSLQYSGGSLSVSGGYGVNVDTVTATVKRAYTRTLVTKQAARFGWRVKAGLNGKLIIQKG